MDQSGQVLYRYGFVSGWADLAMAVEGAAVVVLAAAGALLWRATAPGTVGVDRPPPGRDHH